MSRGYRYVVLAVFGWVALSAQHPNVETQTKQAEPDYRVGDALQNIAAAYDKQTEDARRSPLDRKCQPGDEQRDSDLCAQWKAADAAKEAVWWAKVGTWVSGLSGLLVLAALYAAFRSNWIARDTAKRQLRPYLSIREAYLEVGGQIVWFKIENTGQTPALSVQITSQARVQPSCKPVEVSFGMIGPNSTRFHTVNIGAKLDGQRSVENVVTITITYHDNFEPGKLWQSETTFHYPVFQAINGRMILHPKPGQRDEWQVCE